MYTIIINGKFMITELEADSVEEAEREIYNNYSGIVSVRALTAPESIHDNLGVLTKVTLMDLKRFSCIYEKLWKEVSEASGFVETSENQMERLRALLCAAEVDLEQSQCVYSRRLDRAKAWNEFLGIPREE